MPPPAGITRIPISNLAQARFKYSQERKMLHIREPMSVDSAQSWSLRLRAPSGAGGRAAVAPGDANR